MFGRVTSVLAFLFIQATSKQTYFIFKTACMALFKFIIFRLNFRYILPCLSVPNYAFCLNNAVQVEEFKLWFAQTDTVRAPYCNEGLLQQAPPFPKYIVQMLLLWIHCFSYSRVKNNRNRRNAKSKKKLNSVLIQNKRAWITSRV